MPKHQVIRDVSQSLLGVLRAELSGARSKAKAYLAAPSAEFQRKNAPCLVLYLYELQPTYDVRLKEKWTIEEEITDEKGETQIVRYGRPLELGLRYLLTAAADDLADEHEILALGLRAFLDNGKLTGEQIVGDSFVTGDAIHLTHDTDFNVEKGATVFGALGGNARLAVGYRVEARLYSGKEVGRTKRVRQRQIDVFDQLRPPPGSVSAKELGAEAKPPKIVASPHK